MQMALGLFIFSLSTISYQQLQRQTSWRHASHNRVGDSPDYQYAGKGEDTFTLSCSISHEIQQYSRLGLDQLRAMANTGKAFLLMEGTGRIYGFVTINEMSITQSHHFPDGAPRLTDFTLSLTKVKDQPFGIIGDLLQYGVSLLRKVIT